MLFMYSVRHNGRRNKDHKLRLVLDRALLFEEPADYRYLRQERDPGLGHALALGEDAAEHDRLAVVHDNLGGRLRARDWGNAVPLFKKTRPRFFPPGGHRDFVVVLNGGNGRQRKAWGY